MGSSLVLLLLPLVLVLLVAAAALAIVARCRATTWRQGLHELERAARDGGPDVRMVPREARLDELMTRGEDSSYLGTDAISGLVEVVERAMGSADRMLQAAQSRAAGLRRPAPVPVVMASRTTHAMRHARTVRHLRRPAPPRAVRRTRALQPAA